MDARRTRIVVAVAMVVVAVIWALLSLPDTGRGPVTIYEARLAGTRVVSLGVASCNARPAASVVDSDAESVTIEVIAAAAGRDGDDCMDGVQLTLDEPLGDRRLVDATTGDAVTVDDPG